MAIISFYSNEKKETGQTLSLAAITASMSIEHNYKILDVATGFQDLSLENCFWEYSKIRATGVIEKNEANSKVGLDAGIEGLVKVLNSNRTSNEIVKNYSRIVLRDRLDILLSPKAEDYKEYLEMASYYTSILPIANRFYDLIFVDLSKDLPQEVSDAILQLSDIVILNLAQRLKTINDFLELREQNEFYQRKNIMLNIGRYDMYSKYNVKNITRYLKERKQISAIPYNTLFFEKCSEGGIIDYMLDVKNIKDETDRNSVFVKYVKDVGNAIIFKLQELQMKI